LLILLSNADRRKGVTSGKEMLISNAKTGREMVEIADKE
jgi:hypothetical protein